MDPRDDITREPLNLFDFDAREMADNNKTVISIQQQFQYAHPELNARSNTDLTNMLRDEKVLYANLAIDYAVRMIRAIEKRKTK